MYSGIIIDLNFSAVVSKQTLINTELSPFKTCVYLTLITLFFSDGTQLLCARHLEGDDRAHIPCARN